MIRKHKVVFHLSSNEDSIHKSLIKQLHNLFKALEYIEVEVVTHGPGIDFLLIQSKLDNLLNELTRKDVRFLVCQNTLDDRKLDASSLLSFAEVIPASIAHIILRQEDGWSYIKAGF
ncbi:MAG: DsrE family protein [Sporocytophaga sp.]|uniref:DsrE family protein n=1 Tax=Sporocytophaga sp. TaxID=2231183 RepID=UPI001B0D1731|nr:DsrE family protein [Sporocytophaga sp.]MBO9699029.1 DsrE family protein [Sporocytophaga sp.]